MSTPSIRNLLVWIGSTRAFDYTPLYATGIDIREFFDVETGNKFLQAHLPASADPTGVGAATTSSTSLFAVVATGADALNFVASRAAELRAAGIVLCGTEPLAGSASEAAATAAETLRAVADFVDKPDDVIKMVRERYVQHERTVSSTPQGAARHAKKDTVAISMRAPEGLPATATYVSDGPQGPVWAMQDPVTGESIIARDVAAACPASEAADWRVVFDTQIALSSTCPDLLGPLRYDLAPRSETVRFLYSPRFQVPFERTFRGDPMPLCVAMQTLRVVLRAVQAVHKSGCLFRSISLRNVVFGYDNVTKILTTYVVPHHLRTRNLSWMIPWYCAPEGLRDPGAFSTQSDMFSVGAMLVRMLTGKRPYSHFALDESGLAAYLHEHYTSGGFQSVPADLPAGTPEAIRVLVDRLLSLDPAKRPTCDEVLASELLRDDATLQQSVDAPDRVLDNANYRLEIVPEGSAQFAEVYDLLGRALLKAADAHDLELLSVQRIDNRIVRDRFAVKKSLLGNPSVGFYGAPVNNMGSILRYGVLRSGHRLNPQDVTRWIERGTIGSTKRGIYVSKSPAKACTFTQADPLRDGDVCTLLMCDVALGRSLSWPRGQTLSEEHYNSGAYDSYDGENEVYLLDEAQMAPAYLLKVKLMRAGIAAPSGGLGHRYCVFQRKLGKGAFGVVYLGMQFPESRPVAIKKFLHSKPSECRAEFEVLTRLKEYRHIVKVHHYEIVNEVAYMVMDALACSINELLDNFGPMPEDQVARYLRDAAAGLESLRLEGLVHCDLKPANIGVAYDGTVKLMDFGLSRTRAEATALGGTTAYMAKELFDGAPHSHLTDVYALGATAWSMLTARVPYDGIEATNQNTFIFKRFTQPPPSFEGLALSADFRAVLERCVNDDPKVRPTPLELLRIVSLSSPLKRQATSQALVGADSSNIGISPGATRGDLSATTPLGDGGSFGAPAASTSAWAADGPRDSIAFSLIQDVNSGVFGETTSSTNAGWRGADASSARTDPATGWRVSTAVTSIQRDEGSAPSTARIGVSTTNSISGEIAVPLPGAETRT